MNRDEAETILRRVRYWHYPFELPWGRAATGKTSHGERHHHRRRHFFEPLLATLGGSLTGKSVLDLGCCQGFWSFEAARAGAREVLGLESSRDFVAEARALATLYGIERCRFRLANLDDDEWWLRVEPRDVCFFLGLFYHLADPLLTLRKAAALTREAMVVDTEVVPGDHAALIVAPRDLGEPTTRTSALSTGIRIVPTPPALDALLRDAGFSEVRFLEPDESMPEEYLAGKRLAAIARR